MRYLFLLIIFGLSLTVYSQKELATRAMWEMEKGNLNEAKIKIDLAIKDRRAQKHRRVWYNKGRIYEALYEKNKNEEYADTTIRSYIMSIYYKNNENSDAEQRIKDFGELVRKDGIKVYKSKDYEKAGKLFHTSLRASRFQGLTDSVNYMNIAMSNFKLGEYDDALVYFDTCMQIGYKMNIAAKYTLSTYRNQGKENMVDKKIAEYRKMYPDNYDLLMLEVNNHLDKGRKQDAIKAVNTSIKKYPDNHVLYVYRGDVHLKINDIPKAESDYLLALKKDPSLFYGNLRLGELYYSQSENGKVKTLLKKAITYWERAFEVDPGKNDIYKKLAKAYEQAGEYNKLQILKSKKR